MEGLAEKLEPKERGQPWDGGAVAMRLVSSLGPDRHKLSGTGLDSRLGTGKSSVGVESRLGRDRCNDTWALVGTGKSS